MALTKETSRAEADFKPPLENLCRINPAITLTRSAEDGGMSTMTGHFAKWNEWTEIRSSWEGNFMERFEPSSMTKTLDEGSKSRIKVLYDHGQGPMGNLPLGPIRDLRPDDVGAFYSVDLLDTSYNRDLLPGLEAGLFGASFRFTVMRQNFDPRPKRSHYNPSGIPERTVQEAKVMEFGPVTFPAYAGATAGIRSITDDFILGRFMDSDEWFERVADRLAAKTRTFSVSFNGTKVTSGSGTHVEHLGVGDWPDANPEIADPEGAADRATIEEPEPSEATTPVEPEPSAATTRSHDELFWFVADPKLKGAKKK